MLAKRPLLLALYLLTFLIVGAHFTTYSYIEPFVAKFNPAGNHFATYVPLAFGASGIAASVLFQSFTALFRMLFDLRDPLYPSLGADAKSFCRRGRSTAARGFRLGSGDFWLRALLVD